MRAATVSLVLALALSLSACGSDDDPAASEPEETASSPAASAEETPSESPAAEQDAAAGEVTPDGTELAPGEQAVVAFESLDKAGTVGVTLTGIEAGKPADLRPLDLGAQADGLTPYYAEFEVENLSGTDFSFSSLGLTQGSLGDGTRAQTLSIIGDFAPCPSEDAGADFTTTGATYRTCSPFLAPEGNDVTSVTYLPTDLDEGITWAQ